MIMYSYYLITMNISVQNSNLPSTNNEIIGNTILKLLKINFNFYIVLLIYLFM